MPFKDPEEKKRWQKKFHRRNKTNGYNKWLYNRRRAQMDDAHEFRSVLHYIAQGDFGDLSALADAALEESARRWEKVGPSPLKGDPIEDWKQERNEDDSLMQALVKLGLG